MQVCCTLVPAPHHRLWQGTAHYHLQGLPVMVILPGDGDAPAAGRDANRTVISGETGRQSPVNRRGGAFCFF